MDVNNILSIRIPFGVLDGPVYAFAYDPSGSLIHYYIIQFFE